MTKGMVRASSIARTEIGMKGCGRMIRDMGWATSITSARTSIMGNM